MNKALPPPLVNVALNAPAKISTLDPPHSLPIGAQGIVNGDFDQNFGIHTLEEDAPWWCVDLLSRYPIEAIVIHNRQDMCLDRARSLTVEVSADAQTWQIVHTGLCYFGSRDRGTPLVLPLAGRVWTRFVRLSLAERQALHLSQVEVLVDADKLALVSLRRRYQLDFPMEAETGAENPVAAYSLLPGPHGEQEPLIGLALSENGAFGNCMFQYANAIMIAQKLGLRHIKISENDRSELIELNQGFEIDGLKFLAANAPLPEGGCFLRGHFFDVSRSFSLLAGRSAQDFTSVVRRFVHPLFSKLPQTIPQKPRDQLFVHVRSGDIFANWVNPDYIQPPLSYYTTIIDRQMALGTARTVKLVYQNKLNPVVEPLEAFLAGRGIPFEIQSGSIVEDVSALANGARYVFGLGTFGPAVCQLSDDIEEVFCFPDSMAGAFGIPTVRRVIPVSDRAGGYMKPGDWHNTPEQRQLMVDYPAENLLFPWT